MRKAARYLFTASILSVALSLAGCGGKIHPSDQWPDSGDSGQKPQQTEKPRYIWVDAAANFPEFANSRENIARDLKKAKEAGFTDVVVDVRPTTGDVLFETSAVQKVEFLYAWVDGVYSKIDRTADWDYLQAFIDAGHSLGLRIHAGVNTFLGGRNVKGVKMGLFYREPAKAEAWATVLNTSSGLISIMDDNSSTEKFMNPANPQVQDFLCSLLADLAKYDIDGIVLDRARYSGLQTDFSELSKKQFEEYVGSTIRNFPESILPAGATKLPAEYPAYLTTWLEWRASVIYGFMEKARKAVKAVKPELKFGVYVGGWYSSYYGVGVNWASQSYDPSGEFKWATGNYRNWGYAGLMDHMLIGAYASPTQIYGSKEWTMQGFCSLAKAKAGQGCKLIVGGPDIGNWDSDGKVSQEKENEAVTQSVCACIDACDGYFLFDMVHLRKAGQWDFVKAGIDEYLSKINN